MDTVMDTFSRADLVVALAVGGWLAVLGIAVAWQLGRIRQAMEDEPWMSLRG